MVSIFILGLYSTLTYFTIDHDKHTRHYTSQSVVLEDGWTAVTADLSLSAHFEHTVAILSDGPDILTDNFELWNNF